MQHAGEAEEVEAMALKEGTRLAAKWCHIQQCSKLTAVQSQRWLSVEEGIDPGSDSSLIRRYRTLLDYLSGMLSTREERVTGLPMSSHS